MQVLSVAVTFHAFETASLGHTSHSVPNTGDLATKIFETNSSEKPQCCREPKRSTSGKNVDSSTSCLLYLPFPSFSILLDSTNGTFIVADEGTVTPRLQCIGGCLPGLLPIKQRPTMGFQHPRYAVEDYNFEPQKMRVWNRSFPFQTGDFY